MHANGHAKLILKSWFGEVKQTCESGFTVKAACKDCFTKFSIPEELFYEYHKNNVFRKFLTNPPPNWKIRTEKKKQKCKAKGGFWLPSGTI